MDDLKAAAKAEFSAMNVVYDALEPLDDDARGRVLAHIVSLLDVALSSNGSGRIAKVDAATSEEEEAIREEEKAAPKYGTFAELYDDSQPKTQADKALVAGYWLQICQGTESFDAQSANRELKHLGQGLSNVTVSLEQLKKLKPTLVIQLKKSGKSKQARKVYKVTVAGINAVEHMING